jgi:two-component sensor histidine kinase
VVNAEPFPDAAPGQGLAQAIVDTIREPLLVLDADLRVVTASRSFYLTYKVQRRDVEGRRIDALGDGQWAIPELSSRLESILAAQTAMEVFEIERNVADLGHRVMLLNARRIVDETAGRKLILLSIEDITERRGIERALAEQVLEKEILLQEVPHRVSNSLQIIASILSLKAQAVHSDETREHLQDAHRRVMSVATVQRQLQVTRNPVDIEMAPYLTRLCDALADSMIGDSRQISLKVGSVGGTMSSNEAVSVGLIVTELVINALKHAFVDGRTGGNIVVAYDATAAAGWRLTVCDDGIGQPEKIVAGLGTSIVEALVRQLDARLVISAPSAGTRVSVSRGSMS